MKVPNDVLNCLEEVTLSIAPGVEKVSDLVCLILIVRTILPFQL